MTRLAAALAVLACIVLGTGRAHAFERQWHLGGGLGIATLEGSASGVNPAVGLYAAYGLSDIFDARLELLGSSHSLGGRRTQILSASAGLAYKIDIIQWVPYVDLLVGYYGFSGGPSPLGHYGEPGASLGLGLDYSFSRDFAMGGQLRYHALLRNPPQSLSDAPYFSVLLRAEYRWGW